MSFPFPRSSTLWLGGSSTLLLVASLSTHGGGVQSGANSVPANASRTLNSCAACHSGSQPQTGRTNGPTVNLTATKRALQAGEAISVTTGGTGGVAGTQGGFLCETTAGTFTAGITSRVVSSGAGITHVNDLNRSWTFGFTAPTTVGPLEVTSVVLSANGSSSSGDEFAFSGFDNNATTATPMRLFVLPQGVTNVGSGCPDGYGNYSVLGANSVPARGNLTFAFQLVGATPGTLAFVLAGFNPPGFTGMDLGALFGITGCTGYVASPQTLSSFTSAGVVERAEGAANFPLAIPNLASLLGTALDVQGAYIDTAAASRLGRLQPVTFSNGLRMVVQ